MSEWTVHICRHPDCTAPVSAYDRVCGGKRVVEGPTGAPTVKYEHEPLIRDEVRVTEVEVAYEGDWPVASS